MDMKIEKLEEQTKSLEKPVNDFLSYSTMLEIKSDEDVVSASEVVKQISTLKGKIDDQRKAITDPIYRAYKTANEFFKRFLEPLETSDKAIRSKIGKYRAQQEEKRRLEQEKLDKLFAAEQAKINKKAEKLGVQAPVLQAPTMQESPEKLGAIKFKKVWTYDIVDMSQIPVEYLLPDNAKIRSAINAGARDIKGLKIYQKDQTSL